VAASNPHYQGIRRAIVSPQFGATPEEQLANGQKSYSQLAQEVVNCHNRIIVDQIAIPGGAGNIAILLPSPFPDISYSPHVILDWAAYGYVTAIAVTGFTITFSAAAPGGGGILRLIVIR
jgi:hypothetical protein